MSKTGIFYGSTTGVTADVAQRLAKIMNVAAEDVHDVAETAPSAVADYDLLIFGSSTWGAGDLQDDWYDFLDGLASLDLAGKRVAIFGCGDETMADTFCGAVGEIYKRVESTGATMVGAFPAECYDYVETPAEIGGTIVGLLLDEVNHPDLTDKRLKQWVETL